MASILAASQVLILPSRWEGMPNVVLEAMAARRPVVATDVEGVRELLGDPATDSIAAAQVAALGSEDEFFTRLVALGGDQGLRTRCASANYLRVEQGFAIQAVVKSYEHLYETLVSRL